MSKAVDPSVSSSFDPSGSGPAHLQVTALQADYEALRALCQAGELPVLLLTAAHLSGDLDLLRPEWMPRYAFASYAPHLSAEQEAEAREVCFGALAAFRDAGGPVPGRPSYDFFQEALKWICGKDAESLHRMLDDQIVFGRDDPQTPQWNKQQLDADRDFCVAIVGAGESGLLTAYRLSQAGVPFVILEKNTQVGGTWWENTYPGCKVDINSFIYSYAFSQKVWRDYFGAQGEVLEYFKSFAQQCGLHDQVRFSHEVRSATWNASSAQWDLDIMTPQGGVQLSANVLVSGVGQLNRPSFPDIAGIEDFAGESFHSAQWDASVTLKDKRVAVIGTGASAVQFVPHVADAAAETSVFIRTVPWLLPTPLLLQPVEDSLRQLMEQLPNYMQWHRLFTFVPQAIGILDEATVDPAYPPTETAISTSNDAVRQALTAWVEAQTEDRPELRPMLIPNSPPGSKRLPRDDGRWIRTLKREDVKPITTKIDCITANGIRTQDGTEHRFDVIIYGTGFKASEFLMPMKVTGLDGRDLHEFWNGDARAYLGSTIEGFPNLFCLYGPNTNLVLHGASIIFISECAANYVLEGVRSLLQGKARSLRVKPEVYAGYNERLDEANAMRAWGFSKVSSWYKNAKGRVTQNWPFSALELWRRTRHLDVNDYEFDTE